MANQRIFLDTSALYAFFDQNDAHHHQIAAILGNRSKDFVTSNYIMDELITLFRVRKFAVEQFDEFIQSLWHEEICDLLRVTPEIELAAWEWLKKYKDHPFSFPKKHNIGGNGYGSKNNCTKLCKRDDGSSYFV